MKKTMVAVLLGTLAGCAGAPPPPMGPTGPCRVGEEMRMRYVGAKFALRDRDMIQREANAVTARVLRPGDAATRDYREDRLNIHLGDDDRVDALTCG